MAFYKSLRDERLYPRGTSEPGQAGWVADRLLRLRALLKARITDIRRPNSLIIGSWNIRHFDGGRPRLPESFHYIAEIVDHFDICAIQEVKDVASMERLLRLLGPNWDFFVNDSSGPGRGNHERMAFVYNRNRVHFRHLIGELVLPKGALPGDEQIGRTPFFASFQAGWFKFTLCSAHIVFEEEEGRPLREDEIRVIARELAKRADDMEEVHVFLGDMNTDHADSAGVVALRESGFIVPPFGPTSLLGGKHFDHITFVGPPDEARRLAQGVFPWQDAVYMADEVENYRGVAERMRGAPYVNWPAEYRAWTTHEMSDHLPVWIELEIDYSNEYLLETRQLQAGQN